MRWIKSILAIALMSVAMSASAQFTTSGHASSTSKSVSNGWNTLYFEWNPSTLNIDVKDADNQNFTGLSLGYNHAFGLSKSIPLYVETGLGLQYSFCTVDYDDDEEDYYDEDEEDEKYWMLSAKVPVNLTYAFQIPGSSVTLLPYAGLGLRFNIAGQEKYGKEHTNLFSKKDKDGDQWKRFQIGWQIGLKAHIGQNFMLGAGYYRDFSEIAKKVKISGGNITIGYLF